MLHAVVMAGGSGTRFWPKSRRHRPKQLLRLFGDATMLQQTVSRVWPMIPLERTWIVTGADQAEMVRGQLPDLRADHVVTEPCPRDTAPCVGLAAITVARVDPEAIMLMMPADHVIGPPERFRDAVRAAVDVIQAEPSTFVTFGIRPTHPETGYGYIERDELIGKPNGISLHRVMRFREKPNRATAEGFLSTGRFVWNSGIFLWRANAIIDALARHRPAVHAGLMKIADAMGTPDADRVLAEEFPKLEKIPIDKAVMEKAEDVKVFEVTYDWSDVGDWRALSAFLAADEQGNSIEGNVHPYISRNNIIVAEDGHLIATLAVDDLVIVQSGGATLVAKKAELDRLKELVEGLDRVGFGTSL